MSLQLARIHEEANESRKAGEALDKIATRSPPSHTEDAEDWPEPVDIFAEGAVPPFPDGVLPSSWDKYADSLHKQTGFDPGGYLFVMLAHAGCLIHHQTRMQINDTWRVPAFHWAAIVDASGGGKTPVLNAAGEFAKAKYSAISSQSGTDRSAWRAECRNKGKNDEKPPLPTWRQRHADDTTVEAMAPLLVDNPDGVTVAIDELTAWLGRMDAYTTGGGGKDRAAWLEAWGGTRDKAINRATREPVIVPHWAAGVIGAIQPEVLAQQFRRGQGSTDGLVQRFMLYQMQPAGEPDLLADTDNMARQGVSNTFEALFKASQNEPETFALARDAVQALQSYMKAQRTVADRTAAPRFREHMQKFPTFVARLALTLHCIYQAAERPWGERSQTVSLETMNAAIDIMRVLYRHSEAIYAVLDDASEDARALMESAGEAILSKGWRTFKRGDLTRNATGWQGSDKHDATAAIDLLIELGWVRDVTDVQASRPGRRSDGVFDVNPDVFTRFKAHAERVTKDRASRFAAIQEMAAERRTAIS